MISYDLFDRFFEALILYKELENVVNTATAMSGIIEIIEEYLDKHGESEEDG